MACIRLTNSIRQSIKNRILDHGFSKREIEFEAYESKLAEKIYDRIYSDKHQALMATMPEGFLDTRSHAHFYINGESFNYELPGVYRCASNIEALSMSSDDKLASLCLDHRAKKKAFLAEKQEASSQARAVLASVSTLAKLLEIWPEIEKFTAEVGGVEKPITALAIPIKSLNLSLGLPPG